MEFIKKFEDYNTERFSLTKDEREYLFSKLEYSKKKRIIQNENEIFKYLRGDVDELSEELFIKILDSLEYSFRKKLKEGEIKTPLFKSIKEKIPNNWLGVRYSRLKK
jgi:hypothetical protein